MLAVACSRHCAGRTIEIAADLELALKELPGQWEATVREGHVQLAGGSDFVIAARVAWRVPGVAAVSVPD